MKTSEIVQKIATLKKGLAEMETVAKELLADPHVAKCPFVAPVRGPVTAALERIEHLEKWIAANPVPVAPPEKA